MLLRQPYFSVKFIHMKKHYTVLLASLVTFPVMLSAQRFYTQTEAELQLSYANVTHDGFRLNGIPRMSVFPNLVYKAHVDFGRHFGFFTGLSARNTGFIIDLNQHDRLKQRVLTAGVPFGLKVGGMTRGFYVMAGGEMEVAVNYKEKLFVDGKRAYRFNEWFSERTEVFIPSAFAGARFKGGGTAVYLRYYPMSWYNPDFRTMGEDGVAYPNAGKQASLYTLTFAFNLDCGCCVGSSSKKEKRSGKPDTPTAPVPEEVH